MAALQERFDQEIYSVLMNIETMLINAANGLTNKQNIQISVQLKFRNKTVFGLFTVTVTNNVAVFLVRIRFQNGFLCDFTAL